MKYDVDGAIQKLLPWDLSIKILGCAYRVRPLTVGDVAMLDRFQSGSQGIGEDVATLIGLFEDPKPPLMNLGVGGFMILAKVIGEYAREFAAKNSQAIAAMPLAAIAMNNGPSGT